MKALTVDSLYSAPIPNVNARDLGKILGDVLNDTTPGALAEYLGDVFMVFRDAGTPLGFAAGWDRSATERIRKVFQLQFFVVRPGVRNGILSGRVFAAVEDTVRGLGYDQLILPIRKDRIRFIRALTQRRGYRQYEHDDENDWLYKNL